MSEKAKTHCTNCAMRGEKKDTKHTGDSYCVADGDFLLLFLKKTREQTAQNHKERASFLQSQYARHLQESLRVPCVSPQMSRNKNETAKKGTPPVSDADVIEIELDGNDDVVEKDGDESVKISSDSYSALANCSVGDYAYKFQNGLSRSPLALFSPQSQSGLHGMSPELYTPPLSLLCCQKTASSDAAARHKVESTTTLDVCSVTGGKNYVDAAGWQQRRRFVSQAAGDPDDHNDVTCSLLQLFQNHVDVSAPRNPFATPKRPPKNHLLDEEGELQEFIAWQEEKNARRRECIQSALNCGSYIAKMYAAAQPELRYNGLFDDLCKSAAPPLTPESSAGRYIEWIAADVDLYEDLLLHLTPLSEKVEHDVIEGVCNAVLDDCIMRSVVDSILKMNT